MALAPLALGPAFSARYTLQRELGRGGMATVYLARDVQRDCLVALKLLRPEVAAALGSERFLREIRLTTQLAHPHILGLLDSGEAEGGLYYTMPCVGESLRARLERQPQLPIEEAIRIATEVAQALAYAHEQGVVHRDLKPENILLESAEPNARALVADFGLARALSVAEAERLTATGLTVGTPAYMSPEQASGSRVDRRSDLYSLGCVLYEMLGGEPPYTGPTGQAIIAKRVKEPIPHLRTLRPEIPESIEQAVTRALAKSPADRFASAEHLAVALRPGASAPTLKSSRVRTGRWAVLVGAIALITIGAAGGVALLRHGSTTAAPAAAADAQRVVVAVFQNQTGDPALDPLGDVMADYLARGLAETRLVEVLDARAETSDDQLKAHGLGSARKLARSMGSRSVVWGAYTRAGDSLRFQAHLTDTAGRELFGGALSVLGPRSHPTQGVEALRQRVMTALAARVDPRFAQFEGTSRPASYEAYREYLAAQEMAVRGCPGRDCGAEVQAGYLRAYGLDSSFTLPLVAVAGWPFTRGQCLRTDSIVAVLQPRRNQLPSLERLSLDQAVARCHGKPLLALDLMRQAMAVAPRSEDTALMFALMAWEHGFLREAIAVTENLDRTRYQTNAAGSTGGGTIRIYWHSLLVPYHLLGEHRKELEVARAARATFPGDLAWIRLEARALVGLGQLAEVNRRVDEILALPEELEISGGLPGWPATGGKAEALDDIGRDLRAHSHPAEAKAVFERALRYEYESLRRQSQSEPGGQVALLLYDLGRYNEALPIVKRLAAEYANDVEHGWDLASRWTLGAVYARVGDRRGVERVDRWLARLGARFDPARGLSPGVQFERARLAAILGERERAMALLRQAVEEGSLLREESGLGTHSDPDFESLRNYPPFQKLVRPED